MGVARTNDLPLPRRAGRNGPTLIRAREHPVQRKNLRSSQRTSEMLRAAPDIGLAGKKGEDVPFVFPMGHPNRPGDEFRHILGLRFFIPAYDLHRKHFPAAFHQRKVQRDTQSGRVDGGRHQHQL